MKNILQESGEGIACENHTRRQNSHKSEQEFEEAICQRICLHGGFDRLQFIAKTTIAISWEHVSILQLLEDYMSECRIGDQTGQQRAETCFEDDMHRLVEKANAESDCVHLDARANGWTRRSVAKDGSEESQNGNESRDIGIQQSTLSCISLEETISLVEGVQHEVPTDMLGRCLVDEVVDSLCRLFGGAGDGSKEVEVNVEEVGFYSQPI